MSGDGAKDGSRDVIEDIAVTTLAKRWVAKAGSRSGSDLHRQAEHQQQLAAFSDIFEVVLLGPSLRIGQRGLGTLRNLRPARVRCPHWF